MVTFHNLVYHNLQMLNDYFDYYAINTDIAPPEDLHFIIRFGIKPGTCILSVFSDLQFQHQNTPLTATLKLTPEDKDWVAQKKANPTLPVPAPSLAAERAAEKALKALVAQPYDFTMPVTQEQWQNFILFKYHQLANDPDPKVAKPALDSLAKTNVVGLTNERVEVNINSKSTEELEKTLREALEKYMGKTIEGTAVRV